MFTGIIEAVGEISQLHNNGSDIRLTVQCPHLDMSDVALGDSIATNGVCLTVVEFGDNYYSADVSQETIKYTGFSDYATGAKVNLEKAMLPTSRFGGHIVSGHVDGVGHITRIIDQQKYIEVWVHMPEEIRHYIAHKGSITVDGVSLTVNDVTEDEFMLWLIPHTLEQTIINTYKVGTRVNLEVDVIARYLERLMQGGNNANNDTHKPDISMAFLAENGYLNRK
jgi:riboflavin synthase